MSAVLEETPEPEAVARREKSAGAFRTISEVSEELDIPAHVLRFWESKFPHLNPMKRGGGRRYYRPADLALLRGIRRLLHDEGLTIKGLQKVFRERGPRFVAAVGEGGEVAPSELQAMAVEDHDGPEVAAPTTDATPHRDRLLALIATLQVARDRLAQVAAPAGKRG